MKCKYCRKKSVVQGSSYTSHANTGARRDRVVYEEALTTTTTQTNT